jgi:putative inorganic carbon (HCO3(-)) transporter
MPKKEDFWDYQSLSGRPAKGAVNKSAESEFVIPSAPLSNPEVPVFKKPSESPYPETKARLARSPSNINKEILKRGHGLSYAGLFLFMVILYIRPYEFFPTFTWLRNTAFLVAIATLAVFIPTQLGLEGKLTIRPREVKLVFLLTVLALLSVPQASDQLQAWNGFVDYLKVILMFVVLINVVRTEGRLRLLFVLILVVSCVLSVAAISDYAAGRLDLGGQRIKGIIGGMFDNPNDLALHLVTMIPLAITLFAGTKGIFKRMLYLMAALLMTGGVVVTFSRGGFLGLLCMGSVLVWRIGRHNKWLIIMLLPVVLVGFIIFAPGGYGQRLSTTGDESSMARFDDLKRSVYVSVHHPLLGVGLGNYVLYSNTNHASHNAYTQVSSELGIVAGFAYILFLITPLGPLRKISRETSDFRRKSHYYYLAVGLEASLIGYMVASFFASVAFLWYVYFLAGYAICLRRLYYGSDEPRLSA